MVMTNSEGIDLKRTFPNCQFIISTHSPFIIQSLDADELFDIKSMSFAEEKMLNATGRMDWEI